MFLKSRVWGQKSGLSSSQISASFTPIFQKLLGPRTPFYWFWNLFIIVSEPLFFKIGPHFPKAVVSHDPTSEIPSTNPEYRGNIRGILFQQHWWLGKFKEFYHIFMNTVGTPYNTAPYITGSNIARLGHGSQNSWSKLWIPIMKSAPVRVIFTWKSVPKKSVHGSSDIYLGTQWKQRYDSPWSYRSDVIVTFLWYGTIGIIWHRDHQSMAKKV